MPFHADPMKSDSASPPWYLIWVIGAIVLAGISLTEFRATGRLSSLVIAVAWLGWAFSWYAKPFQVMFRRKASMAIIVRPLRTWVPLVLFKFVRFGALALLVVGIVLKFTNSA